MNEAMKRKYFEDTGKEWVEHSDNKTLFTDSGNESKQSYDGQGGTFHAGEKDCPVPSFDYQIERANELERLDREAEFERNQKSTATLTKIFDYMEAPEVKDAPGQQVQGPKGFVFQGQEMLFSQEVWDTYPDEHKQKLGLILLQGIDECRNNLAKDFLDYASEFIKQNYQSMGFTAPDEMFGRNYQDYEEINKSPICGMTYFMKRGIE